MAISSLYPVFLDLLRVPVLIVGGGNVGLRKAKGLLPTGARVTVVSPVFAEGFAGLREVERITAAYVATHMSKKMWRLVFAATNVREVNDLVQKHAATHSILCCRCDEPELGDFSGGATWTSENGHVTLAVGTTGASPVLAARIRSAAAGAVDPLFAEWAELLLKWRPRVKKEFEDAGLRRQLLSAVASEEMESCLRKGGRESAEALFEKWLVSAQNGAPPVISAGGTKARKAPQDPVDYAE